MNARRNSERGGGSGSGHGSGGQGAVCPSKATVEDGDRESGRSG